MCAEKLETEIRQDQIAQAALSLIGSHGLKALSVARVARQVGLVPSAIYRHFENKEQLVGSVLDLIHDRLCANVEAVHAEVADPLEQLRRLLMRHIRLIRENQGIPRVVFSEEMCVGHPERRAKVYRIVSDYLQRVAGLIREGQKAGRIRSDVDAAVVAVMMLGLVQPAAILWQVSDGAFDVTRQAKQSWRVFAETIGGGGEGRT